MPYEVIPLLGTSFLTGYKPRLAYKRYLEVVTFIRVVKAYGQEVSSLEIVKPKDKKLCKDLEAVALAIALGRVPSPWDVF